MSLARSTGRIHKPSAAFAPVLGLGLLAVGAVVGMALANRRFAQSAQRDNPPTGRFIKVDGVRLHYKEYGGGEPLVLLHGNGAMIEDFETSGLIAKASRAYRVIAFDRPGFGHSERPPGTLWTPAAQAELIHHALERMGVSRALALGHSFGALVALELALRHPESVSGLVLVSGYYYPTARADVAALSNPALFSPAIAGLGDVLSHTITPFLGRALWPSIMGKLFEPARMPAKFEAFPKEMALRPSQVRAGAQDAASMIPAARAACHHYSELDMPVVIIAGAQDKVVDCDLQSARLHEDIADSVLHLVPHAGHMVHQTATHEIMAAIDEANRLSLRKLVEAD